MDSKHSKQYSVIDLTEDDALEATQPEDSVIDLTADSGLAGPVDLGQELKSAPAPEVGQGNTILAQRKPGKSKKRKAPATGMQGSKTHKAYMVTFFNRPEEYKWASLGLEETGVVEFFRVQLEGTKDEKLHWQGFIKFTDKVIQQSGSGRSALCSLARIPIFLIYP